MPCAILHSVKNCGLCRESKSESEFYRDSSKRDGLQGRCKSCKALDRARKYILLQEYLAGRECADCGNEDSRVLQFDHLPEYEKSGDVSAMLCKRDLPWKRILEEIGKCEVVCANCHAIRTAERGGYARAGWTAEGSNPGPEN